MIAARAFAFIVVISTALLTPIVLASEGGFQLVATSATASEFEGLADLQANGLAFVTRARSANGTDELVTLRGNAASVIVERHEDRWTRLSQPRHFEPGSLGPSTSFQQSERGRAEFQLTDAGPWLAIALTAEAGSLQSLSNATVQAPVRSPCLSSSDPRRTIGYAGPNERGNWCVPGDFLVLTAPSWNLTFRGNITLYWFDATLALNSSHGSENLDSRTRYETGRGTGVVDVLHAVWYVLRLQDAELQVQSLDLAPRGKTTFLANHVVGRVSGASFAAPVNVTGTLPNSTRQDAASIWLVGNMSLGLQALKSRDPVGRQWYRIQLAGPPEAVHAYSYGGGEIHYARRDTSLVVPTTAAILLVVAALYAKLRKDRLLAHGARETIYRLVGERPGISPSQIEKELARRASGDGFTRHHLKQLERFGLVVTCKVGRSRRLFRKDAPSALRAPARSLLENEAVGCIAAAILRQPGLSRESIYKTLQSPPTVSRSTLSYYLGRLASFGLVVRKRVGTAGQFYPTQALVELKDSLRSGNTSRV